MRDRALGAARVAGRAVVSVVRRVLQQLLPLGLALYTNYRYLRADIPDTSTSLPHASWVTAEAGDLLARSEDRLETLESKGPGLATVCAIVAAAVGVAISLTWDESTTAAQAILVVSGAYSIMSLYAPVVLVGPVRRRTVTAATLEHAGAREDPEGYLAKRKAHAAAVNDRTTLRLSNLQAAARNDVLKAILLFAAWAIIALTGHAAVGASAH